jgi:hypothetical protein
MTTPKPFRAKISVPEQSRGTIVTQRIACRRRTHILAERFEDAHLLARRRQYRLAILKKLASACEDMAKEAYSAQKLVPKFTALATILEDSKVLAFPLGMKEHLDNDGSTELDSNFVRENLLRPLSVALLAFQLGGPVNAAFTFRKHEWRMPANSMVETPHHHMEGDTGDIFDGLRVTTVWEAQDDGTISAPSGTHNVFLTGDATAQPLRPLESTTNPGPSTPLLIMYDSQNAALSYYCQDSKAVRKSITLDFHVNTIADDALQLLSTHTKETDLGKRSLADLVAEFPVANYATHFHRLLFSTDSMDAILTDLSTLNIPLRPPPQEGGKGLLRDRFEAYKKDNLAHLPAAIKVMHAEIPIVDSYISHASFLARVCNKARRDVHLPIGADLFPQTSIDEHMELARRMIRDSPEQQVCARLMKYEGVLTQRAFTAEDLISTSDIQRCAKVLELCCLELIGVGFVDKEGFLASAPALLFALGNAMNGLKEVEVVPEPWIDDDDLQIYRTRCLYLFWLADWLLCYLLRPEEGQFMLIQLEEAEASIRRSSIRVLEIARSLLRNWVAWGMFTEGFPRRGFYVRQPME